MACREGELAAETRLKSPTFSAASTEARNSAKSDIGSMMSWLRHSSSGSMAPNEIPERSTSSYAGQYARCVDPQRLIQILTESMALALNSQNPDTAGSRYELAIEAYHQLLTLPLPASDRVQIQASMAALTRELPAKMCMNEARGHCAKAAKLKTPRRKQEFLLLARATLERGLAVGLGGGQEFEDLQKQVLADIAAAKAQASTG